MQRRDVGVGIGYDDAMHAIEGEIPVSRIQADAHQETKTELAVLADMPRQYARGTTHSIMGASPVIEAAEKSTSIGRTADWRGAMEELAAASKGLRSNDLSQAEDMLIHQAMALQPECVSRYSKWGRCPVVPSLCALSHPLPYHLAPRSSPDAGRQGAQV